MHFSPWDPASEDGAVHKEPSHSPAAAGLASSQLPAPALPVSGADTRSLARPTALMLFSTFSTSAHISLTFTNTLTVVFQGSGQSNLESYFPSLLYRLIKTIGIGNMLFRECYEVKEKPQCAATVNTTHISRETYNSVTTKYYNSLLVILLYILLVLYG